MKHTPAEYHDVFTEIDALLRHHEAAPDDPRLLRLLSEARATLRKQDGTISRRRDADGGKVE